MLEPVLIRKNGHIGLNESSSLQPIFTFVDRWQPPVAVYSITAAKEEVRRGSTITFSSAES